METITHILWPTIIAGFIGRSIDFLIGRTGQERVENFLLEWWVRFDDIRKVNLGKEDALFIASVIDRWFGAYVWSQKRLITASIFAVFSVILGTVINIYANDYKIDRFHTINILLLLPTMCSRC